MKRVGRAKRVGLHRIRFVACEEYISLGKGVISCKEIHIIDVGPGFIELVVVDFDDSASYKTYCGNGIAIEWEN